MIYGNVVITIGGKYDTTLLGDTNCFSYGGKPFIIGIKVIHRTQKQSDVVLFRRNGLKIYGIALLNGYFFSVFRVSLKYFNIALHKFYSIHFIAILSKIVRIPTSTCANLKDAHTGFEILLNIINCS